MTKKKLILGTEVTIEDAPYDLSPRESKAWVDGYNKALYDCDAEFKKLIASAEKRMGVEQ